MKARKASSARQAALKTTRPTKPTSKSLNPATAPRKKLLLVDDHPMMRAGLTGLINQQADVEVCCEAGTVAEALAEIPKCSPDLIVTDITLPGRGGLELIKDVKALHPDLPVLVISMHDDMLHAERALRAGARGY